MDNYKKTSLPLSNKGDKTKYKNQKFIHICEICGKIEILTPEEGFFSGWDYPPQMYSFKVISPRTCGGCGMKGTVWWEVVIEHKDFDQLSEKQKQTLHRIYNEPESIIFTPN